MVPQQGEVICGSHLEARTIQTRMVEESLDPMRQPVSKLEALGLVSSGSSVFPPLLFLSRIRRSLAVMNFQSKLLIYDQCVRLPVTTFSLLLNRY